MGTWEQPAGERSARPTMGESALRCNGVSRVPSRDGRPVKQRVSERQAAIEVPVRGTWLRAGMAMPALRRAATRFGRSGWEDISSTRLVQKFSQVSAPEVRQLVTHDEANRCLALIER